MGDIEGIPPADNYATPIEETPLADKPIHGLGSLEIGNDFSVEQDAPVADDTTPIEKVGDIEDVSPAEDVVSEAPVENKTIIKNDPKNRRVTMEGDKPVFWDAKKNRKLKEGGQAWNEANEHYQFDQKQSKAEYTSEKDGFFVSKNEDGNMEVYNPKTGKEASPKKKKQVIDEYKDASVKKLASQGKPTDMEGIANPEEATRKILEESDSPSEIATAWKHEQKTNPEVTDQDKEIAEFLKGGKVVESSYKDYASNSEGTPEYDKVKKEYLNKADDSNVHEIHLDDLPDDAGFDAQDVVDFIERSYPEGLKSFDKGAKENPIKVELEQKFKELTGMELDEEFADKLEYEAYEEARRNENFELAEHYDRVTGAYGHKRVDYGDPETKIRKYSQRLMDHSSPNIQKLLDPQDSEYEVERTEKLNDVADQKIDDFIESTNGIMTLKEQWEHIGREAVEGPLSSLNVYIASKAAYYLEQMGEYQIATNIYNGNIAKVGTKAGQIVNAFKFQNNPEGQAIGLLLEVHKAANETLFSKTERGVSLHNELRALHEKIRITEEKLNKARKNSRVSKAISKATGNEISTEQKRQAIRQKRKGLINEIKDLWNAPNTGFHSGVPIPVEIVDKVAELGLSYLEEAAVIASSVFNRMVSDLRKAGMKHDDAKAAVEKAMNIKDAFGETLGEKIKKKSEAQEPKPKVKLPIEKQPKGKQEKADMGPLEEPSPDVELTGEVQPKGSEQNIEFTEEDTVRNTLGENIDQVIDDHYSKDTPGELWPKLMAIEGFPQGRKGKRIAKAIEKALTDTLRDENAEKQIKAIKKFAEDNKKKAAPKKKADIERIVNAVNGGAFNDFDLQNQFADYFGYPSLDRETMENIKRVVEIIRLHPSKEVSGRAKKELNIIHKRLEGRTAKILSEEVFTMAVLNALTGIGTQYNTKVGAFSTVMPHVAMTFASSPIASINYAKQWWKRSELKLAWQTYWNVLKTNYSELDDLGQFVDYQFKNEGSLMEAFVLDGYSRILKKHKGKGVISKVKTGAELGAYAFLQQWRMAFELKAFDAFVSHQVGEYISYVNEWNDQLKKAGIDGTAGLLNPKKRFGSEFINRVEKAMGYDEHTTREATRETDELIEKMKADGEKIQYGFRLREIKRKTIEKRDAEKVKTAYTTIKQWLLMSQPTGIIFGPLYNMFQNGFNFKDTDASQILALKLTGKLAVGMFLRISATSANMIINNIPVVGMMNHFYKVEKVKPGDTVMQGKRKIKGWAVIPRSKEERNMLLKVNAAATAMGIGLLAHMFEFEEDEEGNTIVSLNPDRNIDITGVGTGKYYEEKDIAKDYKRFGIRYRKADGEWTKPWGFRYLLPLLPVLSILGGLSDDIKHKKDKLDERNIKEQIGSSTWDIVQSFTEMTFSANAQNAQRIADELGRGEKGNVPGAIGDVLLRPGKSIVQPNLTKDFYNEWRLMTDRGKPDIDKGYEKLIKDVAILELWTSGIKHDQFGNTVYRDSNFEKTFGWAGWGNWEYLKKNKKVWDKPEWKLLHRYEGVISKGLFYPDDTYEVKGKKVELSKDEQAGMRKLHAELNGQYVRKYMDKLQKLGPQELQVQLNHLDKTARQNARLKYKAINQEEKTELELLDDDQVKQKINPEYD
jgi:hypothetical protein